MKTRRWILLTALFFAGWAWAASALLVYALQGIPLMSALLHVTDPDVWYARGGVVLAGLVLGASVLWARARSEGRQREGEDLVQCTTLLERSMDGAVLALLEPLRLVYVNDAAARLVGRTPEALMALSAEDLEALVHPEDVEVLRRALGAEPATEPGGEYIFRLLKDDGSTVWLGARVTGTTLQGHPAALITLLDVTQREMEHTRVEHLARFPAENPHPVLRVRADGTILYANPASRPLLDCWHRTVGEAVPDDILSKVHQVLGEGQFCDTEATYGETSYSLTLAPVTDMGYVSIYGVDTTEHKRLEDQLRQSQKMEAIGRLAGGVAHDFNNLLTIIEGYSTFALDQLEEGNPVRPDIEEIRQAGVRAAALVRQLLTFSRKQVVEPKIIDLNLVLKDMTSMLERLIGEDVTIEMRLAEPLHKVFADRGLMEQAIVNLVVNARDAMPTGGRLTIETANVTLSAERVRNFPGSRPGPHAMVSVSDSGTGMSQEVQAHLFEPFFTTKPPGIGTGLGLAQVYGIVRQCGGIIEVESELGKGSTFRIYLPLAWEDHAADEGGFDGSAVEAPGGDETILVVEDQAHVRSVAGRMLRTLGYTVLEASDGYEAMGMFRNERAPQVDLVLTDVVMPGVSGKEMADTLRRVHPSVRIVYMSGYNEDVVHHRGVLHPGVRLVHKPFSLQELAQVVRSALDADDPEDAAGLEETAPE